MARLPLNVGANANDGTGDTLRAAMVKINTMFTEVYTAPGISSDAILIADNTISAIRSDDDLIFNPSGTGSVTFPALRFNDNNIEGTRTNEDINIIPSGTGTVVFGALAFSGNNITSTRSNDNINLIPAGTGSVVIGGIKFAGTSLSSDDSSIININEGLIVDGTANVSGTTTLTGAVTASSTLGVTGAATLSSTLAVTGVTTLTTTNSDNLTIQDNIISSASNADINITPGGTGSVILGSIKINDNNIEGINSNEDIKLIPIPIIKNKLLLQTIVSCKIPHIFFLFNNKSFGLLIVNFFFINLEITFLILLQFLKVMFFKEIFLLILKKIEINKLPLCEIHFFPRWPLPFF